MHTSSFSPNALRGYHSRIPAQHVRHPSDQLSVGTDHVVEIPLHQHLPGFALLDRTFLLNQIGDKDQCSCPFGCGIV